jgi:hypothetical protein
VLKQNSTSGLSFSEYAQWAKEILTSKVFDQRLGSYLDNLCASVGLTESWEKISKEFGKACLQASKEDEYSLYLRAAQNPEDPALLLQIGLQCLLQTFLRFRYLHNQNHPVWLEMANRERLPMTLFFNFIEKSALSDITLGKWLETLYKEFILGQHEYIALEKLRYQRYDTFKFYFREGRFYWPFDDQKAYREPIRLAGNRLNNALSILGDLGLVSEDEQNMYSLTDEGKSYLTRAVESC